MCRVERLGNIWGGRKVLYVNTEVERLEMAVVNSIKHQQAVFFGCDVGQMSNRGGEMDLKIYDVRPSPRNPKLATSSVLRFELTSLNHPSPFSPTVLARTRPRFLHDQG
jgi:aminopeptidase C